GANPPKANMRVRKGAHWRELLSQLTWCQSSGGWPVTREDEFPQEVLKALDEAGRKLATPLDCFELAVGYESAAYVRSNQVRCRDGVLDREIDAQPAHW